jgi:hypothetical protein
MNFQPIAMNRTMTETFKETMMAFTVEDSWIPLINSKEISTIMETAGRLIAP